MLGSVPSMGVPGPTVHSPTVRWSRHFQWRMWVGDLWSLPYLVCVDGGTSGFLAVGLRVVLTGGVMSAFTFLVLHFSLLVKFRGVPRQLLALMSGDIGLIALPRVIFSGYVGL